MVVMVGGCYLRGTEMRYSWKKAEVKKTMSVAVMRELPEESSGLYRCRTHHLQQPHNHCSLRNHEKLLLTNKEKTLEGAFFSIRALRKFANSR